MPAPVPKAAAAFAGLATVDIQYLVDAFPAPDGKVSARRQAVAAGGPAANAAVAFAHFSGAAVLLTALGRHPLAGLARADLSSCAVRLHDAAPAVTTPPPLSSICVLDSTGERTVVSANAQAFDRLHYVFDPAWLDGASLLLVDGHHLELALLAAAEARRRRIEVVLDGGSWKPGLERLLPHIDIAICSGAFPRTPAGLHSAGISHVAVTRGSRPIVYSSAADRGEIPVTAIRAVDTLGAGDIFHGAFCAARAAGAAFPEALRSAAAVATESCLHWGTRSWRDAVPSLP